METDKVAIAVVTVQGPPLLPFPPLEVFTEASRGTLAGPTVELAGHGSLHRGQGGKTKAAVHLAFAMVFSAFLEK